MIYWQYYTVDNLLLIETQVAEFKAKDEGQRQAAEAHLELYHDMCQELLAGLGRCQDCHEDLLLHRAQGGSSGHA